MINLIFHSCECLCLTQVLRTPKLELRNFELKVLELRNFQLELRNVQLELRNFGVAKKLTTGTSISMTIKNCSLVFLKEKATSPREGKRTKRPNSIWSIRLDRFTGETKNSRTKSSRTS